VPLAFGSVFKRRFGVAATVARATVARAMDSYRTVALHVLRPLFRQANVYGAVVT